MKIFGLEIRNRIMEGALSAESTPTTPPPRVRWVPIDYSGPEPRFVYEASADDGTPGVEDQDHPATDPRRTG